MPLLTVVPVINVVTNPALNLAFELLLANLRLSRRLSTRQDYIGSFLETDHGRLIPRYVLALSSRPLTRRLGREGSGGIQRACQKVYGATAMTRRKGEITLQLHDLICFPVGSRLAGMAKDDEPIRPMTLGSMRRHGVRGLFVTCQSMFTFGAVAR